MCYACVNSAGVVVTGVGGCTSMSQTPFLFSRGVFPFCVLTLGSDIYRVDEVLARSFNMLFSNLARSGFTLVVIAVTTPPFLALIIPLGAMYVWIQRYYLRTSRELKRLDSVSRSPIYAHFQESLGGISTIRAYRQQDRFELENEWRVDANLRAYFPSISANRWLAVRLEFIGAIVILAAAGFAVIAVATGTKLGPGMVGLAMSYGLQITTSLNWIVRQTVEVETNIVSVERVLEYARLPSEAPEIIHRNRPPVSWPSRGEVEFVNYSARYREGLDLVLKNISLDIKSHEKIGVVGRTGAGKSSLTLALFRIIEPDTGNISLDGLNTSTVGLLDLRRRLAIIPQDAALFEGTIRDNLDPGHVHDDTELWSVLGMFSVQMPICFDLGLICLPHRSRPAQGPRRFYGRGAGGQDPRRRYVTHASIFLYYQSPLFPITPPPAPPTWCFSLLASVSVALSRNSRVLSAFVFSSLPVLSPSLFIFVPLTPRLVSS